MVSPKNIQSFKEVAKRHRWQLSTMIKNVQKLIDESNRGSTSFNILRHNFVLREGGIKEFRQIYLDFAITLVRNILYYSNNISYLIGKEHPMTWDTYHSKDDMEEYLDYLVHMYPDRVSIETIGYSYEGRIMRVAKVNIIPNWHSISNILLILYQKLSFMLNFPNHLGLSK